MIRRGDMTQNSEKIKNRDTVKQDALKHQRMPRFSIRRWVLYLILAPIFIVMVLLSVFFFSVLFLLFLYGGLIFSLWIWWLRRKMRRSTSTQNVEGECIVVREIYSGETKNDKAKEK